MIGLWGEKMELREIPVAETTVYEGMIVRVRHDKAQLIDGKIVSREVVEHPGGVAIFAIDENENVILVKQFRYPMGEAVLELPAGKLEHGEAPELCALRELEEETGIRPGELHSMGYSYSSPGIFTEKIHLFFARDLQQGEAHPDEGEFLDVMRIPLNQLLSMVRRNQIFDAKTIAGVMKGTLLLRGDALI